MNQKNSLAIARRISSIITLVIILATMIIVVVTPTIIKGYTIAFQLWSISEENSAGHRYTKEASDRKDAIYEKNDKIRVAMQNSEDRFERTFSTNRLKQAWVLLGMPAILMGCLYILKKAFGVLVKSIEGNINKKSLR